VGYSAKDLRSFLKERRDYYDAVLVSRPHNMREVLAVTRNHRELIGHSSLLYDAEALFASRELLRRELSGEKVPAREATRMLEEEIALTRSADAIVTVSPHEKKLFEENGAGPVFIMGYPIDPTPTRTPFENRTDLLFVGAIHDDDSPNADSLRWFAH